MFKRKRKPIDLEIDRVIKSLNTMSPGMADYTAAVNNLEILYKSKSYKNDSIVSKDVLFTGIVSSVQIMAILYYERLDIVTSRAIGYVIRLIK